MRAKVQQQVESDRPLSPRKAVVVTTLFLSLESTCTGGSMIYKKYRRRNVDGKSSLKY